MRKEKQDKPVKKSWKAPAPQPPVSKTPETKRVVSPPRSSNKPKAPNPPNPPASPEKNVNSPKVNWDQKVLESLASITRQKFLKLHNFFVGVTRFYTNPIKHTSCIQIWHRTKY